MASLVPFPQFIGADYRSASVNVATSQLVNWFVEPTQSATDQTMPAALMPTPGLTLFATGLSGPIRGMVAQDGRCFVCAGQTVYEVHGDGRVTVLGRVVSDDRPASLVLNGHGGHQLLVISGGLGYIYDTNSGVFLQVTDAAFPSGVVMADFLDGYFLVVQATTSTFYLSQLFNGLVWSDPVQSGQVSSSSDTLQGMRVIQRNLWLFGSQRSEVWVTSAGGFPLEPLPGSLIEYGLGAAWSVAECDGTIIFIGRNEAGGAVVLRNQGYGVAKISTTSEDQILSALPDLRNVRAFAYQEHGHTFYVACPPTGPAMVYNVATGLWHQQGTWQTGTGQYGPLRYATHVYAFGRHLVGDRETGTIYEMSQAYSTEVGVPIRRLRQAPHVNGSAQWIFGSQVAIRCETGLATPADPAPALELSWSKDGGHVFSPPVSASLGGGGDYGRLVRWTRAPGRFQDLVLRLTTTAQTPVRVIGCDLRVETGRGQR